MDSIIKTDVCIIGAGPSGAATSMQLAKSKITHCIIDKAVFPRDKTCGDGLILYAYKAMKLLDESLFTDFLKSPKFLHSKTINLHINNNLKVSFKETEDREMVISYAKRIDFDNFLVERISNTYAQKFFGNRAVSLQEQENGILIKLKDGTKILAKMIVGADGAQSIVSKKLAKNKIENTLKSTFISAYFSGVENMVANYEAEVRIIYKKVPLFFYVFPLADGQVNVSLGGRTDQITKLNINLIDEIEHILKTHPFAKNMFKNAKMESKWRGWLIPFQFDKQKIIGNRFLLVGDAAGLANAFYKEGVGTGMMSGILAANTIEKCIIANDFSQKKLTEYKKNIQKEFKKLLRFSHYALRFARFKSLFSNMVTVFKKTIERKSFKLIKNRSY
ncbi:geranylgeranyl reductase family protein [Polaribacter sp.]|uniref:geranylgeranyl reductase family protein n=1 Tax=Polaribacter sp. TaxID=1920175 RepID=UPI003F6D0712